MMVHYGMITGYGRKEKFMIVKYNIKKQYKPDDLKNKVRRMQRVPIEMRYQKQLIQYLK